MATLSFEAIAQKTQRKVDTVFQEFTQDLSESVIDRTPIRTGFLAGSWFLGINNMSGPEGQIDTSGAQTIASIALTAQALRAGDVAFIANNANYAAYVEYGTMSQAPRAMIRKTLRDANQIMTRTANRIKRQ